MEEEKRDKLIRDIANLEYHKFINVVIEKVDEGKSELRLSPSKNTLNFYGFIHGGIYYSVLDLAAFIACVSKLNEEQVPVTSNINVSVMKAVSSGDLRIEAKILKLGKKTCFLESKAFDKDGDLVATSLITKAIVPRKQK